MPARPPRHPGRSWPQRLVLVLGGLIVVGCLTAASAAAYLAARFSQIDRVDDLEITATEAGEPANYLLVGTDSREGLDPDDPDAGAFLAGGETGCDCTDTIMVLRIDPEEKQARILSFPRDLWVPISGTGRTDRINTAHSHGEQTLIDTIKDNFGITINHYVEIDFVAFQKLVDAVGGIPMWFDAPLRDKHSGLSIPEAECQVLDGEQARKFVRSRYLDYLGDDGRWHRDVTADLGRITRQQIFIRRAVSKAVSKGLTNPVTLNELVSAGVENLRLDGNLDAGALIKLGGRFAQFNSDELLGYSIPSDPFKTAGGAAVEIPNMRRAEAILNVFRGLPPGTVSPESIELTVLNGTGIDGQAADVAGAMARIGFAVEAVDTYTDGPMERTRVVYGDGGEDAARRVARHITGGADLVYDADIDEGEVTLIVGADFTTVHDQPAPEGSPDDVRSTTSTTAAGDPGSTAADPGTTTTTAPAPIGYGTGEPPPGVSCG